MVRLYDKSNDAEIGTITDDQLQFLADKLEEESAGDDDYYINRTTVHILEQEGGDPELIGVLRGALGEREEMDIRWERD
jgi:processive 1,2-diacylglycerol beta-glucosyltransferase